jgi:hypothetical protein
VGRGHGGPPRLRLTNRNIGNENSIFKQLLIGQRKKVWDLIYFIRWQFEPAKKILDHVVIPPYSSLFTKVF